MDPSWHMYMLSAYVVVGVAYVGGNSLRNCRTDSQRCNTNKTQFVVNCLPRTVSMWAS